MSLHSQSRLDPHNEVTQEQTIGEGLFQHELAVETDAIELPGYEILAELGRGGMGVVYKARQISLNRMVALKMILAGAHAGERERGRFLSEAEAIARLQHPGIVQILDHGDHNGIPYFTLELIAGGSLADQLNEAPLTPSEAAALVEQIAMAIDYAHQRNIIHRDLKPANILLEGKDPKITDFGLARAETRGEAEPQTETGTILGTPSYMAPEQAQGRSGEIGPAADLYALGAILYACLTGRPPFQGATPVDTLRQVTGEEPLPPSKLQPGTPRDLETICLKCLQKAIPRRYSSAKELAEDLQRFQKGEPVLARPIGARERTLKWVKRRPAIAALIAVIALVLLSATGVSTWFAIEGNRQARRAKQLEAQAQKNAQRAQLKEKDTQAALGRTEAVFAESLASIVDNQTLWEIATLPLEQDRARLLVIEKALSDPLLSAQPQTYRLASAAVGLRLDRREKALQLLRRHIAQSNKALKTRLACALMGVVLNCTDPEFADGAIDAILTAMENRIVLPTDGMFFRSGSSLSQIVLRHYKAHLQKEDLDRLIKAPAPGPIDPQKQYFARLKIVADLLSSDQATEAFFRLFKMLRLDQLKPVATINAFAKQINPADAARLTNHLVDSYRLQIGGGFLSLRPQLLKTVSNKLNSSQKVESAIALLQPLILEGKSLGSARVEALQILAEELSSEDVHSLLQKMLNHLPENPTSAHCQDLAPLLNNPGSRLPTSQLQLLSRGLHQMVLQQVQKRLPRKHARGHEQIKAWVDTILSLKQHLPEKDYRATAVTLAQKITEQSKVPFQLKNMQFRFHVVSALAKEFNRLRPDLLPKQARHLATRIADIPVKKLKTQFPDKDRYAWQHLNHLTEGLLALRSSLDRPQWLAISQALAETLAAQIKQTGYTYGQLVLIRGFGRLAGDLPEGQKRHQVKQLCLNLIRQVMDTTDPSTLSSILPAFTEVIAHADPVTGSEVAKVLFGQMVKPQNIVIYRHIHLAFSQTLKRISPKEKMDYAVRLLQHVHKNPKYPTYYLFSHNGIFTCLSPQDRARALEALIHKQLDGAPSHEIESLISPAVKELDQKVLMAIAQKIPQWLKGRPPDVGRIVSLLKAFMALAEKLPPELGRSIAARLWSILLERAFSEPGKIATSAVESSLTVLKPLLTKEQLDLAAKKLLALLPRAEWQSVSHHLKGILYRLVGEVGRGSTYAILQMNFAPGLLERGVRALDLQQLVHLLKRPDCSLRHKQTIIQEINRREEKAFDNLWQLVEWLKKAHPEIDSQSPPEKLE